MPVAGTSDKQSTTIGDDDDDDEEPRLRTFPPWHLGPYIVYVRQKDIPLTPLKISEFVHRKYKSVTAVTQIPRQKKMKITMSNINEANAVILDQALSVFSPYIRADEVEIAGVISYSEICDVEDLEKLKIHGLGKFLNPQIPTVKIVDVHRLWRTDPDNQLLRANSNVVKVTFEGRQLPSHVLITGLLVKVRPWFQRAMFCDNCQRFQHTSKFCKSKPSCAKCSGQHLTTDCDDQLIDHSICPYCNGKHAEGKHNCPHFRQVNKAFFKRQEANIKRIAQHTQNVTAPNFPALLAPQRQQAQSHVHSNRFSGLAVDEEEVLVIRDANAQTQKKSYANPWANQPKPLKRKLQPSSRNTATVSDSPASSRTKSTPPQTTRTTSSIRKQPPGLQSFSASSSIAEVIIQICSAIGLSDQWMAIVKLVAPIIASLIDDRTPKQSPASVAHALGNVTSQC